jgi:hypothetical protein
MARLRVAHWPGDTALAAARPGSLPEGLTVETCLRRVWVGLDAPGRPLAGSPCVHYGAAAYRFLLEFITGLHSAVPGETNVLGQFRQSWRRWQAVHPAPAEQLTPTITALLEDARQIRRQYLQGVGGDSYGSLARRLVRPGREDRILIVGAGELARSIWPFFRHYATGGWNHRPAGSRWPAWLSGFDPAHGAAAARWATHVILATPPDPANDQRWQGWLQAARPATVLHLGHRRAGRFAVPNAGRQLFLEQLLDARRDRANVRSLQLARARAACAALARQRTAPASAPAQRARA